MMIPAPKADARIRMAMKSMGDSILFIPETKDRKEARTQNSTNLCFINFLSDR